MKKKLFKIIHIFILFIIAFIFSFSCYMFYRFSSTNFEQILFTIFNGVSETGGGVIRPTVKYCIPFAICIFGCLYFLFYDITFGKYIFKIKNKQIYPFSIINKYKKRITFVMFLLVVMMLLESVHFSSYLSYLKTDSTFIEENYVDPKKVDISFDNKRNLIFILVESLETSLFTKNNGGYWDYEVIPELSELLDDKDTVVFYNQNKAQQMIMVSGASWTTAAIVANNTGLPLKVNIDGNSYHSKKFLNGAYSIGEVLKENGYYNEVISGATTTFGGVKEFYTRHGDYSIGDGDLLGVYNLTMSEDDKGTWGINDNCLFNVAKERLNVISKNEQPFNINLITIDTHFIDGFIGKYSLKKYKEQYENVYATTSKLIYDFVEWVKEQPYYKNTTIVVAGDHLSMQNDFFNKRDAYVRYVYDIIINPYNKTDNYEGREYSAFDNFPTILSAIGANIKGDKLGLGVNLFSGEKTLIEEYGIQYVNDRLQERSSFYNEVLLDDDYFITK